MTKGKHIVILTGAGLSAESGLGTFRDKDGLWAKHAIEDVATPEGFARDPAKVLEFYNIRRKQASEAKPNRAHEALARLENHFPGQVIIVTQNIDPLHEWAGSKNLIHMHGEILKALCGLCNARIDWDDDLKVNQVCGSCGRPGGMRPDVVWFGEMPYRMNEIEEALVRCGLFVSIGTSGNVYPAAGFVAGARAVGAHTVELNLEPSTGASLFDEVICGPATEVVPDFASRLMAL